MGWWAAVTGASKGYDAYNRHRDRRQRKRILKAVYKALEENGMRTSTNAGIAGVVAVVLMKVIGIFAPDLAMIEGLEASITGVVMWVVARVSKTPASPGKI